MFLENLYDEMRRAQLVRSAYDFSRKYLGRSPNYYSVLKARQLEPSIGTVLNLEKAISQELDVKATIGTVESKLATGCLLVLSRDLATYRNKRLNRGRR